MIIKALGPRVSSYANELLEAPEEEGDFDILNDETFGDIDQEDYDWEQQTEKFAEVLGTGHKHESHNDSGFNTAEKTYRSQEEYMEHSISQLMVDEDDGDPAILRSRPIPRVGARVKVKPQAILKPHDLDSLFGPSSPPSLLDAEHLISPTSKNIWGSPHQNQAPQPTHFDNIQAIFDFAKSANSSDHHLSHHGPHSRAAPMVLPKAQTLEEIESSMLQKPRVLTAEELERQLRGESSLPPSALSSVQNGHRVSMAQYNVPPPPVIGSPQSRAMVPPNPMPGVSPGVPHGVVNGHRSPVFGGPSAMRMSMPRGIAPGTQSVPISMGGSPGKGMIGSPMVGTPPYRNSSTPLSRQSPVFHFTRRSPLLCSPTSPPMGMLPCSPLPIRVPARFHTPLATPNNHVHYIVTPSHGLSQPIGIPLAMRGPPPVGSPFSSPQAGFGSPQGPGVIHPSPQQHRMVFHSSLNDTNMNRNNSNKYQQSSPHMKGQYFNNNNKEKFTGRGDHPSGGGHREHRYYRYPYNQKHEARTEHSPGLQKRDSKGSDPYDGLMTQRDKEWIIKIQLLQLQTDNPLVDDFYYTAWCLRKKAREQGVDGEGRDPRLVIPALARMEHKAYKPAQFEGSLGRLTTSSVHNPRQIIDLLAKSMSEQGGGKSKSNVGKELRKSRQLLMDIEKGYNILLIIEDLETKILALPEDTAKPLLEERSNYVDLLFHYLLCDGNSAAFMQYMNVRKGRSLTRRALPLLDKVQSVGIVSLVCKNLQQLMRKDQGDEHVEELFEPCAKVIETCNLATVVMFAEDIQQEESPSTTKPIALALQNKFGSSILCTLLHRGEKIYSSTSPVDLDSSLQNEWCEFVHDFASIVATIPSDSIASPLQTHPDIMEHLGRLLNKRLLAVVEDNLDVFIQPRQS
ncbi:protein PAT1 homolog 1-like isoform X2 [Dreissena polymorpha]|nr:protein PAT1 homolog 1-like isoform X2 [Dreissena polymorpha]